MKKLLILVFGMAHFAFGQEVSGEVELAGFLLGQERKAVHAALGTPVQKRITKDGWIYEFQRVKPDTSVYALFKYPQWDTTRVYSIQLNGDSFDEMHPFCGFKLGASKETVYKVFGEYDHTTQVDDPPLTIQYYKNKNYSVEIDQDGKVYGIQVFGSIQRTKPVEATPSLKQFAHAITSKNVDSLLTYLAPDAAIFYKGSVITYAGAARAEFQNKDSQMVKHLLGDTNSVWYAFTREMAEGALHNRTIDYEEGQNMTYYYQMYDSSILSEVVFVPHAGKWKVSEIKFR
jgi:hypothetical protein